MKNKPKVLVFIDWFYPAFKAGGPIKSVYNIVNALSEEFSFSIITSAYDLNELVPLEGIVSNQWHKIDNYSIIYLEKDSISKRVLFSLYKEIMPDYVYLNSLYSYKFTLIPLLFLPRTQKKVLATRGMLGRESLKIKRNKKIVFIKLLRHSNLLRNLTWHASSDLEKEEILNYFGNKKKVHVAQNIAMLPEKRSVNDVNKQKGKLNLIFFSRINEIKNLLYALETLRKVNSPNISLDVFGPIEDEVYWAKCKMVIDKNNLNVNYRGILKQRDIPELLWKYDYLFFPTKHENYGHVIAESLCSSLPVILSKNTPWLNLERLKIGFDFKLTEQNKFVELLSQLVNQSKEDYSTYLSTTFEYSKQSIVNRDVIVANKNLFKDA